MRWVLLLLMLPLVAAHPGDEGEGFLNHINQVDVTVAPGEALDYHLAFTGQPFSAGWEWLLQARVEGQLQFRVDQNGVPLKTWTWGSGAHVDSIRLPADGYLDLHVSNPGDTNSSALFYYDQSCNCQFKRVPMNAGAVWFNINATAGQEVDFDFTVIPQQLGLTATRDGPSTITIKATHVRATANGYEPLKTVEQTWDLESDERCFLQATQWSGCTGITFIAEEDGRQLVWFEASHDADDSWGVAIRPLTDVREVEEAPGLALPMLLLGLLVAYRRAK